MESDRNSAKISINQNGDLMYAAPCRLDHLNTATLQAKVRSKGPSNRQERRSPDLAKRVWAGENTG